jgi:flagellum-specific peptidoglycan hydrolase FlgJ
MDIQQRQFLDRASQQAETAGHLYPTMAACEAALESGYGTSGLSISGNNLFGMKQHTHPIYGTLNIPTREFEGGEWVVVDAEWVKYPDWAACFADRLATLNRLAPHFPNYAAALSAADSDSYVLAVSKTWSTDPARGEKVQAIHGAYLADMEARP